MTVTLLAGPLNTLHLFIQSRDLISHTGADKRFEKQETNSHYLLPLLSVLTFPHSNLFLRNATLVWPQPTATESQLHHANEGADSIVKGKAIEQERERKRYEWEKDDLTGRCAHTHTHTLVFEITAVHFKKESKAQNPNSSFYFHTHKCMGNTAHSILNQNIKIFKFVPADCLQKVKKEEY